MAATISETASSRQFILQKLNGVYSSGCLIQALSRHLSKKVSAVSADKLSRIICHTGIDKGLVVWCMVPLPYISIQQPQTAGIFVL